MGCLPSVSVPVLPVSIWSHQGRLWELRGAPGNKAMASLPHSGLLAGRGRGKAACRRGRLTLAGQADTGAGGEAGQTTAPRAVGRVGRLLSVMLPMPRRPTRPSGARELSVTDRSGERCQCDLRNNTEANGLFSPSCRSRARLRMLEDGKEPSHSPAVESGTGSETSVSL